MLTFCSMTICYCVFFGTGMFWWHWNYKGLYIVDSHGPSSQTFMFQGRDLSPLFYVIKRGLSLVPQTTTNEVCLCIKGKWFLKSHIKECKGCIVICKVYTIPLITGSNCRQDEECFLTKSVTSDLANCRNQGILVSSFCISQADEVHSRQVQPGRIEVPGLPGNLGSCTFSWSLNT